MFQNAEDLTHFGRHSAYHAGSGGGTSASLETHQKANVWPGELQDPTKARSPASLEKSVIAMVESGLEALAENQTTNKLLAERGGDTPRRGPHAFSSRLTALSFPRTGRFSIREVVLEGYATRQKTGISSQSAQAIFLCLRKRLSLSTHPRFIKSLEDPKLLTQLGTPARPPKPRGKANGRQKGAIIPKAKRFPVTLKTPKLPPLVPK